MTGSGQARDDRFVGLCLAAATLALVAVGCGSDGNVGVKFPPTPHQAEDAIQGVVQMPNGQFAAAGSWWDWAGKLDLLARAYAVLNPNVSPVGSGALVAVSRIDPLDASDGSIDAPVLVAQDFTNDEGRYNIINAQFSNVDQCRLMVAVGGGEQLTRAFVTSHDTNVDNSLDAVSEATVRVVLNRLTKAPPVQLCDFSTEGLKSIYDAVSRAAYTAKGTTVAQINDDAYAKAVRNTGVKQAIDAATGVPVAN